MNEVERYEAMKTRFDKKENACITHMCNLKKLRKIWSYRQKSDY